MYLRSMEPGASAGLAIVHPERNIHAFDLLQMVGFGEGRWQQRLFEIVLLQCLDGILLAQLEAPTGFHSMGKMWLQSLRHRAAPHRTMGSSRPSCRPRPRPSPRSGRKNPSQSRLRQSAVLPLQQFFELLPFLPASAPLPLLSLLFPHRAPQFLRYRSSSHSNRTPACRILLQNGAVPYRRDIDNL